MAKKKKVTKQNTQANKLQKELNALHQKLKQFGVTKQELMTYVKESERANRIINAQIKSGLYYGNKTQYTYKTLDKAKSKEQLQEWLASPKHVLRRDYVLEFNSWVRGNMEQNAQSFFGGSVSFKGLTDKQLGRLVMEHPEFEQLQKPSPTKEDLEEGRGLFMNLYDQANRINLLVERYKKIK